MAAIMHGPSQSLIPTALGLLVALLAFVGRKYFLGRVADFDAEMEIASLQLLNQLGSIKI